ncbi:MAG: transporter substrate-binding domain-containing protein [Pseudomonadales bacterium]|nr:transporter substrate-binding domain-containing protein [Pseudomonadales bacterium]
MNKFARSKPQTQGLLLVRQLLLLVVIIQPSVISADEVTRVLEVRTIGIPPYGIESASENDKGDQRRGAYYDISNRVLALAGYEANNLVYPYARIINEMKTGQTDLTIMFKYSFLDGHVEYVAPLPRLKTVVIGLEGSNLDTIGSLSGKSLAYLRGAQFSDEIDADATIRKQITDDFNQAARMLVFGRVDAVIGPLDPLLRAIAETNSNIVLAEPLVVSERTPWIQVSAGSELALRTEALRLAFEQLESSGELRRILDSYQHVRDADG